MWGKKLYILNCVVLLLLVACGTSQKKSKAVIAPIAFQMSPAVFSVTDEASASSLKKVLQSHIAYWKVRKQKWIRFGEQYQIQGGDYVRALQKALWVLEKEGKAKLLEHLSEEFVFLSADEKGKPPGTAFFTSYFEPVLPASLVRDDRYWQPLYEIPKDMLNVDMGAWAKAFPRWSVWSDRVTEKKSRSAILRGRIINKEVVPPKVVPYWSRKEIDEQGMLGDKARVIAYLDPVDSFFLQIQGSGALMFPSGVVIRVGYAAQNGHPYTAIGKHMFDVIPRSEMSMQSIEDYLHRISAQERQEFLNLNPSYVFFRKLQGRGVTYMGTEVVDGRTIATDTSWYPKGTLAWISIPGVDSTSEGGGAISRLVMDQDTGGAIRGSGRVDLFWGQGEDAKMQAGKVKNPGQLFHLFPKTGL